MSPVQHHLDAIERGAIMKTNVIGIRKALAHVDRLRKGWRGNRSNATAEDTDALEKALARHRPTVIGPLHDSGLKLIRSPRWASRFSPAQRKILNADHVRFDLIRFDRVGRRDALVPVYCVVGFAGKFCFRNIPWQTAYYDGLESGPIVVEDN